MLHLTGNPDGSCTAHIAGTTFDPRDPNALNKALEPYAAKRMNVRIVGSENVPYRCIGGVIYTMQRTGMAARVGFIAEPEPDIRKPAQ